MRAEHALLLACDGQDNPRLAELARDVADWDYLQRLSAQHGTDPRLYASLLSAGAHEVVPPAVWDALKSRFQANASRNLRLAARLLALLEAFSAAGVRVLPYKGPVLAQTAYGNLVLREMADLDLLIAPAQVSQARQVAGELGYRPVFHLTPRQTAAYLRNESEYDLIGPDRTLLDLHWQLVPRHLGINFDFDAAWERRRPICLGGREIPALSPEDTVLVVAVHGSKHLWERLCWLHDLAACLRAATVDWDVLLARASAQGARQFLLLGLHLAGALLAADLPAIVHREIARESSVLAISANLQERLLAGNAFLSDAQRWRLLLRLAPGWRRRFRCAAGFAFTSGVAEWNSVSLPDRLFSLYALVRLARIAGNMLGSNSESSLRGPGRPLTR